MRRRWIEIGVLAAGIFAVNAISRFVTWKGKLASDSQQATVGFIAVGTVAVVLIGASAWWAVRYPFPRLAADIAAAVGIAALLSVLVGPFFGGIKPFSGGLEGVIGQLLLFIGLATVGVLLGFVGTVALGKDWRSRSLRRYAQAYRSKPHRIVRH